MSDGGQTEKGLHRLSDGTLIESVLMHYPARGAQRERHTLCMNDCVRLELHDMFPQLRTGNVTLFKPRWGIRLRRDEIKPQNLSVWPGFLNPFHDGPAVKPGAAGDQNALRMHVRRSE